MTGIAPFPEPRQTIRRVLLACAAATCFAAGLFVVLTAGLPDRSTAAALYVLPDGHIVAPEVGAIAPPFTLETSDGETIPLEAQRGKVAIINFWATWCVPCRVEMPALETLAARHPDSVTVLGVNVGDSPAAVRAWQRDFSLTFPLLLDPAGTAARDYRLRGQPTTIIVTADGFIHSILYGPADIAALTRAVTSLLPALP